MRSAATIETGNVIVIVSPSAIFPLDGSITTPPASAFAFDGSSSSSSCPNVPAARQTIRVLTRTGARRRNSWPGVRPNGWVISFLASCAGSAAERTQLRAPSQCGGGIVRVRLPLQMTRELQWNAFATRRLLRNLRVCVRGHRGRTTCLNREDPALLRCARATTPTSARQYRPDLARLRSVQPQIYH